jgi:hypothetical protein
MAATKGLIRAWLEEGQTKQMAYMLVVCDTFDHEDYPVYCSSLDDLNRDAPRLHHSDMQKVMECYDLSMDLDMQMSESRAWHGWKPSPWNGNEHRTTGMPMPTDFHAGGMGERDFVDDEGNWWIDRREREVRLRKLGLSYEPMTGLIRSHAPVVPMDLLFPARGPSPAQKENHMTEETTDAMTAADRKPDGALGQVRDLVTKLTAAKVLVAALKLQITLVRHELREALRGKPKRKKTTKQKAVKKSAAKTSGGRRRGLPEVKVDPLKPAE